MGKAFLYGSGGGSALNFSLKAYSTEAALLADTPKENTIGIVTTTAIGKAAIKATQPTTISGAAVAEGDVWILDGTSSPAAMQVNKKSGVEVWAYPLICKQYVSGTWVAKTAKSYIGGTWMVFAQYLYYNGDEYTGLTGGWSAAKAYGTYQGLTVTNTTALNVVRATSDGAFATNNAINLTGLNTIHFVVESYNSNSAHKYFTVNTDRNNMQTYAAALAITGIGKFSLDVSSLSGLHYVGGFISTSGGATTFSISISNIYYE